ncbi:MAG: hypothetical protein ACFFC7_11550 [Candidatus Hermodarchaeota archaeon]
MVLSKKKIVHHQFHKYSGGKIFRKVLSKGVELFKQNNCIKWLSDDRQIRVVNQEDADWARDVWYAQLSKAGWKYWALVKPENIIGKMSLKRHIRRVEDPNLTLKIFVDPQSALEWLESMN